MDSHISFRFLVRRLGDTVYIDYALELLLFDGRCTVLKTLKG